LLQQGVDFSRQRPEIQIIVHKSDDAHVSGTAPHCIYSSDIHA
jgi:hypothetical protein